MSKLNLLVTLFLVAMLGLSFALPALAAGDGTGNDGPGDTPTEGDDPLENDGDPDNLGTGLGIIDDFFDGISMPMGELVLVVLRMIVI